MRKIIFALLVLCSLSSFAQVVQTSYVVPSIATMKTYYGYANRMHVTANNSDYVICSPCTTDEVNIYAGAGGRKWMKVSDSTKADVGGSSTDNWDSVLTRQTTPMSNDHTVDFGGHRVLFGNVAGGGLGTASFEVDAPNNSSFGVFAGNTGSSKMSFLQDSSRITMYYNQGGDPNSIFSMSKYGISITTGGMGLPIYIGFNTSGVYNPVYISTDSSNANPNNIAWFDNKNILHRGYLPPRLQSYTVSTLPSSPAQGDEAAVTDATSPTYLGSLTGGGSTYTPVIFNGTIWVSH